MTFFSSVLTIPRCELHSPCFPRNWRLLARYTNCQCCSARRLRCPVSAVSVSATSALAGMESTLLLGCDHARASGHLESVWRRWDVPGDPPRRMTSEAPSSFLSWPALPAAKHCVRRLLFSPANLRLPSSDTNCYQTEASNLLERREKKPRGREAPLLSASCAKCGTLTSSGLLAEGVSHRCSVATASFSFFPCDLSPVLRFRLHVTLRHIRESVCFLCYVFMLRPWNPAFSLRMTRVCL